MNSTFGDAAELQVRRKKVNWIVLPVRCLKYHHLALAIVIVHKVPAICFFWAYTK
eukprot:m.1657671 g.1657671  ORF g.1657671 m.1657671 type:complete len:55 (-) comp113761_c0_seq1:340-504(-)